MTYRPKVLEVANGGTGAVTLTGVLTGNGTSAVTAATVTQNGVLIGGASNAVSSLSVSAANTILAGNTSAAPSFKSLSIVKQVIVATGTYTPTSGLVYATVQILGGGGAGGGAAATGAGTVSCGGGGGAGEYAEGVFSAATIAAAAPITATIGAAGTGSSGATGGNGGNSSLGSLITANGGSGGVASAAGATARGQAGAGGTGGTGGSFRTPGMTGVPGLSTLTPGVVWGGEGSNSQFGSGGLSSIVSDVAGTIALGYGAGGGGACDYTSASNRSGGNGVPGIIVVTEYVLA